MLRQFVAPAGGDAGDADLRRGNGPDGRRDELVAQQRERVPRGGVGARALDRHRDVRHRSASIRLDGDRLLDLSCGERATLERRDCVTDCSSVHVGRLDDDVGRQRVPGNSCCMRS